MVSNDPAPSVAHLYAEGVNDTGPHRTLPSAEDIERFRAMRGKYPRAAELLDVARGVERGYPDELLEEIAAGD